MKRKRSKPNNSNSNYSSYNENNPNNVSKNLIKDLIKKVENQSILENRAKTNERAIDRLKARGKTVIPRTMRKPVNFGLDSMGQRLGVWIPPKLKFDPEGKVNISYRTFYNQDPKLNPEASKLHINNADFPSFKMNLIPNKSSGQFYRVLKYKNTPYPQPITRIFNNSKGFKRSLSKQSRLHENWFELLKYANKNQNRRNGKQGLIDKTPVNAIFSGTLLLPTYTHYHKAPDNSTSQILRMRRPLIRRMSGLGAVFIPEKSLKNYLQQFKN